MIVWDLGGVVASFRPDLRLRALAELTGIAPSLIHERIWGSGLDADAEVGRLSESAVWERLLIALEHGASIDGIRQAWSLAFEPNPIVLATIDAVDEPAALLSNNGPVVAGCLNAELREIQDRFTRCLLSCQLGYAKPHVEAFRRAAEVLAQPPAALTLIDDQRKNVDAARRAGWNAIHFTTADDLRKVTETRP